MDGVIEEEVLETNFLKNLFLGEAGEEDSSTRPRQTTTATTKTSQHPPTTTTNKNNSALHHARRWDPSRGEGYRSFIINGKCQYITNGHCQ